MNKPNLANLIKRAQVMIDRRSPEILMGLGIAGMITTTVLAVRATPKAMALIEEERMCRYKELDDDYISKLDMVKTAWKPFVPVVVSGATSIACLIGSASVSTRRTAALAAAYQISETALTEYREKVIETIGEKKEKAVRDKVDKDRIEKNPVNNSQVVITGDGTTMCYDTLSGRYFKSNRNKIERVEIELNQRMLNDITGYVSLNEFYDELGLDHIVTGDDLGWNVANKIELHFGAQLTESGEPCVVVDYRVAPKYNYDKW